MSKLKIPFALVAGSHMGLLKDQFFIPFYENGFRGIFDAFISNGNTRYKCEYEKKMKIEQVFIFDLKKHLGEKNYEELIGILKETLRLKRFMMPSNITVLPEKITDRVSMINFIPMGRADSEGPKQQEDRRRFVEFDKDTNYRRKVIKHLEGKLRRIFREKKLRILLGGQTSFDIVIDGYDKTYPLYTLKKEGWEKIIFIGDALYPGGNDYVIQEYINNWKDGECPYETIKTEGWRNTIEILKNIKAF